MASNASFRVGCLLGMAAGDALGCAVDHKTQEEIYTDYGPGGLQGYDLTGDFAQISSHTQLAAMTANGLLVALSRGRTENAKKYMAAALQEWSVIQHSRRIPEKTVCWLSHMPAFTARNCLDSRLPLGFSQELTGTPEAPTNRTDSASALMAPVAVGLFYDPKRMEKGAFCRLALETAALTHGAQEAFLSGCLLAMIVCEIGQHNWTCFRDCIETAVKEFAEQFSPGFSKAQDVAAAARSSLLLAEDQALAPQQVLEQMHCDSAKSCLQAAIYVCSKCQDIDSALVMSVNHSGASAAVGAVVGAMMGARLGEENIPDFYLDSLESADALRILAKDLTTGSATAGLFDSDWDRKYYSGLPV